MKDYLDRIKNYIFDDRFTRALLIDGDWGCGKSYFVKHTLVDEIEKTVVKKTELMEGTDEPNDLRKEERLSKFDGFHLPFAVNKGNDIKEEKKQKYKAIIISLYGLSKVEDIQSAIFAACIEKFADKTKNDKASFVFKNTAILGATVIKAVGSFFSVGDEVGSVASQFGDVMLSLQKEQLVLIFDDVERCQIDIIELMGFLNNLCENNGYRVILIANEDEISRQESEIATAIQSQIALIDLGIENISKNRKNTPQPGISTTLDELNQSRIAYSDDGFKQELVSHREKLFEKNDLYERTREKLIGLTIRFEANLDVVYEDVLNSTLEKSDARDYLFSKKEFIIGTFEKKNHENLRTLISLFIAVETIWGVLKVQTSISAEDSSTVDVNKIIEEEKTKLLTNLTITAINLADGKAPSRLNDNVRYGLVGNGLFSKIESYLKYTFVDEYWEKLTVNADIVNEDFNKQLDEVLKNAIERVRNKSHYDLALFRLRDWYYRPDEEVQADVQKLKKELEEKKYEPSEFKTIICTLIGINDAGFGMSLEPVDYYSTKTIYDAFTESVLDSNEIKANSSNVSGNLNTEQELSDYKKWNKEDINEYVKLMLKYTNDPQFCMDKEMLRLMTEDKMFARKYRTYIQPLLDWLNEKELTELKEAEDGKNLFDIDSKEYYSFFSTRKNTFFKKGKCLALYGADRIEDLIRDASALDLSHFTGALHEVYNLGNIRSFLADDYDTVNKIWLDLKHDRELGRPDYNVEKSRTKEIALRGLEADFHGYRDSLRNPREILEENMKKKESEKSAE